MGRGKRLQLFHQCLTVFLLTYWWFQGITTVAKAHLHSRFIHPEKASARLSSVAYRQKDHVAAGRRLTPRLFDVHYLSLSMQDSFQTPQSCRPSVPPVEGRETLQIWHLCYKVNEGAPLTLLQLLLPSPLARQLPDCY